MYLLDKWENEARVVVKALECKSLREKPSCFLIVAEDYKQLSVISKNLLEKWQLEIFKDEKESCRCFKNRDTQVLVVILNFDKEESLYGQLCDSLRVYVRNQVGQALHGKCDKAYLVVDENSKHAHDIVTGVTEAITFGAYSFKNTKKPTFGIYMKKALVETAHQAWQKAEATNFARFLVDMPANELNPQSYVQLLQTLVKGKKDFKITVKSKDLKSEGYELVDAVGKGAENPPALVRVSYTAPASQKSKSKKTGRVAFVGKGITFDTGGLDLKPSNFMRLMKKDMGGSAAIAGLLFYHLQNRPDHDVDYFFAIAENSVDSNAFRPGDVYRGGNGLSVEIHNTDAEGRLVLADALAWLAKDKTPPEVVIDVATLTGAIKAGLGSYVGGLFSNDRMLSQELQEASARTGDHLWPMPMPYWTETEIKKSEVADLVNATDGYGGAITAAQFLKQFVPKKSKWAHLDIYAWIDSARGPFKQKGGSGQGVLVLLDWLQS